MLFGVRAGGYWNSHYRLSLYGGVYFQYAPHSIVKLRISVAYISGYTDVEKYNIVPVPVFVSPSIVIGKKPGIEIQAIMNGLGFSVRYQL